MSEAKICTKCKIEKPISAFSGSFIKRINRFYFKSRCNLCYAEESRNRYAENPEKCREISRRWQKANPDKHYENNRRWCDANREKVREKKRLYATENSAKINEKRRNKYAENPEKIIEKARNYRSENRKKIILADAKRRATQRGTPFSINEADILIPETCPVLGIKLESGRGHPQANSPSLDCFIPELGYVKGNVEIISNRANTIKSNATFEEIEKLYMWMKSQRYLHI